MRKNLLMLSVSAVVATACSSGGDDNDFTGGPDPVDPQTGIFLDSPVVNLDYRNATGTRTGTTSAAGEFTYRTGESLTFSIGALALEQVSGCQVITPFTVAKSVDAMAPKVNNLVRLLLTLDKDANPANGIEITETAKGVATQVDFSLAADAFAASAAVTNLIFNGGQDLPVSGLVGVDEAAAHFNQTFIANELTPCNLAEFNEQVMINHMLDNSLPIQKHGSGMYYAITTEGAGESPLPTSTVTVKYQGTLPNGFVFDQTSGDNTATFDLEGLIAGWRQALPLLKPGGKGTFVFPPDLGYGAQGSRSIPPNAVIIFEIELISFE